MVSVVAVAVDVDRVKREKQEIMVQMALMGQLELKDQRLVTSGWVNVVYNF